MSESILELDLFSEDLPARALAELIRVFPEIRTEGNKIDFEQLKIVLGDAVDVGRERYGLTWPGKSECFATIQARSIATLRPDVDASVDFDDTGHVIIEGDNLEVLKLLQKSYLGLVKLIFIDPPYNTGNDFIYPDDYAETLRTYLEYTGQVDAEGHRFGTNPDSAGRFHSRWLNMMCPRLYLARALLRDDGFLVISIDDHEVENLRRLCDEILGEENFVASVIWHKSYSPQMDAESFSTSHDYIVVYRKSDAARVNRESFDQAGSQFNYTDEASGRSYRRRSIRKEGSNSLRSDAPSAWFPLAAPDGTQVFPYKPMKRGQTERVEGVWRWSRSTYDERLAAGEVEWIETADEGWQPYAKQYLNENATRPPTTIWSFEDVGHTHEAAEEVAKLLGPRVFDTPKPTRLLRRILGLATTPNNGDLVLDFFAGSGSTAHAVLAQNDDDGGNRRFILVQLPERTGREDFRTISEVTRERVRRVIGQMERENRLDLDERSTSDCGFRAFRLDESNFTPWDADSPKDDAALAQQLAMHVDHIRNGRNDLDLLYEILLKSGYPLSTRVETIAVAGKTVYSVAEGALLVCLERHLTLDLVRAIAERQPERVVLLDVGFEGNDQLKTNAVQTFKNARREDAEPIVFRTI